MVLQLRALAVQSQVLLLLLLPGACPSAPAVCTNEFIINAIKGGDPSVLPPTEAAAPVRVVITTSINKVILLPSNTQTETFQVNMYFRQEWMDPRLRWDPAGMCGRQVIYDIRQGGMMCALFGGGGGGGGGAHGGSIWCPDTYFATSEGIQMPDGEEYITVRSDGTVLWSRRMNAVLFCAMNFAYYPFDSQDCVAEVASYSYPDHALRYALPSSNLHDFNLTYAEAIHVDVNSSMFSAQNIGAYSLDTPNVTLFENIIETRIFSGMRWHFTFHRQAFPKYYINTFLPLIVTVMLSFLAPFLSPGGGERAGVSITAVVVLVALMLSLTPDIPIVSYPTGLDVYYVVCILFVAANMVEVTFVNWVHTKLAAIDDKRVQRNEIEELWKTRKSRSKSKRRESICADVAITTTSSGHFSVARKGPHDAPPNRLLDKFKRKSKPKSMVRRLLQHSRERQAEKRAADAAVEQAHSTEAVEDSSRSLAQLFPSGVLGVPKEGDNSCRPIRPCLDCMESLRQHSATIAKRAEMREYFDIFDRQGNGEISYESLAILLDMVAKKRRINLTPDQIEHLVLETDEAGDGIIDFDEFTNLVDHRLSKLFASFDEESRALTLLFRFAITETRINFLEGEYRFWCPMLFVVFNLFWFSLMDWGLVLGVGISLGLMLPILAWYAWGHLEERYGEGLRVQHEHDIPPPPPPPPVPPPPPLPEAAGQARAAHDVLRAAVLQQDESPSDQKASLGVRWSDSVYKSPPADDGLSGGSGTRPSPATPAVLAPAPPSRPSPQQAPSAASVPLPASEGSVPLALPPPPPPPPPPHPPSTSSTSPPPAPPAVPPAVPPAAHPHQASSSTPSTTPGANPGSPGLPPASQRAS